MPIPTTSVPLFGLPKSRLSEALEYLAGFDAVMLGDLDQISMAVLVWIICRIRPNMQVTELRGITYMDLYETMETAAHRVKEGNETEYNQMIQNFMKEPCMKADDVMSVAVGSGVSACLGREGKRKEEQRPEGGRETIIACTL